MLATVAAADSAKVQKKSIAFLCIAKRSHAMYAIFKQTRILCVLQYIRLKIVIILIRLKFSIWVVHVF